LENESLDANPAIGTLNPAIDNMQLGIIAAGLFIDILAGRYPGDDSGISATLVAR
jgi:hypothetical protein